ncbi:MAG: hypothetical protein ACHQ2Y_06500, partial [Candidatus Lutacidiplasmatales archaeon]
MASQSVGAVGGGADPTRVLERVTTAPDARELERAKDDSLLQLRLGRSAHYYAVVVSALLLIDGFLVLLLQPSISANSTLPVSDLAFLAFPVFSGLYIAFFSLRVKWEVYQLWPWEPHFWVSFLSVPLNVSVCALYLASVFDLGPTGRWPLLPGFYPLSLLGIALPLVGLALTWNGWTERKLVASVSAALPVPIALGVLLPQLSGSAAPAALAVSLFAGAVLFQMSGSFLHLISSGTRTHEREVISSGQSRILQLAEEIQERERAMAARLDTVARREADVQVGAITLARARQSHEVAAGQLDVLERDLRARMDALSEERRGWAAHVAEVRTLEQSAADKEEAVLLREKDLALRLPHLAEREQRQAQVEGELARREADLLRRDQEVERRVASALESEARSEARRKELDARSADLSRQESELRSREAMVVAPPGVDEATAARRDELEQRHAVLDKLKSLLDEQNRTLGRRAKELEELARASKDASDSQVAKEATLARREAELSQRELSASESSELGAAKQREYSEMVHAYEKRVKELNEREASLEARAADLERVGSGLRQHETSTREESARSQSLRKELDRRERLLAEREAALHERTLERPKSASQPPAPAVVPSAPAPVAMRAAPSPSPP